MSIYVCRQRKKSHTCKIPVLIERKECEPRIIHSNSYVRTILPLGCWKKTSRLKYSFDQNEIQSKYPLGYEFHLIYILSFSLLIIQLSYCLLYTRIIQSNMKINLYFCFSVVFFHSEKRAREKNPLMVPTFFFPPHSINHFSWLWQKSDSEVCVKLSSAMETRLIWQTFFYLLYFKGKNTKKYQKNENNKMELCDLI